MSARPTARILMLMIAVAAIVLPLIASAAPVEVIYPEGVTRAFPVLKSLNGERLAHGDLWQVVRGNRVEGRLVFRFKDGSIYDESVTFAQEGAFRLLSYRIVQRGPSFPETIEATIDRASGRYEVRYRSDESTPEELLTGSFAMPDDVYNGMLSVVVKNLPARTSETVSIIAFTPKPRAVKLQLMPTTEDRIVINELPMTAIRYIIRPQLGLLASLLVVDVPDVRMWIVPGEAPAFLRAEGPLYFMGPVWRIEPY